MLGSVLIALLVTFMGCSTNVATGKASGDEGVGLIPEGGGKKPDKYTIDELPILNEIEVNEMYSHYSIDSDGVVWVPAARIDNNPEEDTFDDANTIDGTGLS